MKYGMRKPSIKKSIKARTTGKVKRQVKKAINPLYGKKGIGYIKNPKKTLYNKIYNKTTFKAPYLTNNKQTKTTYENSQIEYPKNFDRICWIILSIILPILCAMLLLLCIIHPVLLVLELLLILSEIKLINKLKRCN